MAPAGHQKVFVSRVPVTRSATLLFLEKSPWMVAELAKLTELAIFMVFHHFGKTHQFCQMSEPPSRVKFHPRG